MRASDADREAVAAALARHYAAGRLTWDEHAGRVDACYRARTLGELRALLADLPESPPDDPPSGTRSGRPRRTVGPATVAVPLLVCLVVASVLAHAPVVFVAIPAFVVLARRGRCCPAGAGCRSWSARQHRGGARQGT